MLGFSFLPTHYLRRLKSATLLTKALYCAKIQMEFAWDTATDNYTEQSPQRNSLGWEKEKKNSQHNLQLKYVQEFALKMCWLQRGLVRWKSQEMER